MALNKMKNLRRIHRAECLEDHLETKKDHLGRPIRNAEGEVVKVHTRTFKKSLKVWAREVSGRYIKMPMTPKVKKILGG